MFMNSNDAPSAKLATCFVTIGSNRYAMMMAKNFSATASVETSEVPILGRMIKGVKPTGLTVKISMTIYKCTDVFDEVIEKFKNTGVLPTFDVQVTSEDPATSIGSSSKVYNNVVIDGDVLLSMFDADGEFVEQDIEGYAQDFATAKRYTNPDYMG